MQCGPIKISSIWVMAWIATSLGARSAHADPIASLGLMYLYGSTGAILPQSAADGPDVAWRIITDQDPDAARLKGVVAIENTDSGETCSGALIQAADHLPGDAPVYVLSAGHCYSRGDGGFGDFALDQSVENLKFFSGVTAQTGATPPHRQPHLIRAVAYSAMYGQDLSLFETDLTVSQLRALGLPSYPIARQGPAVGDAVEVDGIPTSGMSWDHAYLHQTRCEVLGIGSKPTRLIDTEGHALDTLSRDLVFANCSAVGGTSGSPLFSKTSGAIFAVTSSVGVLSKNQTDDLTPAQTETFLRNARLANAFADATVLSGCFDARGRFAIGARGCRLGLPCASGTPASCAAMRCSAGVGSACYDEAVLSQARAPLLKGCKDGDFASCAALRPNAANLESACRAHRPEYCAPAARYLSSKSHVARELLTLGCDGGDGASCAGLAALAPSEEARASDLTAACYRHEWRSCVTLGRLYVAGDAAVGGAAAPAFGKRLVLKACGHITPNPPECATQP